MWIFSIYGMYSIACASKRVNGIEQLDTETVMVRARTKQHLENLQERFDFLRQYKILSWNNRDYRWRFICPKHIWASALAEMSLEQEWSNFKNEATANRVDVGSQYIHVLHEIWNRCLTMQDGGLYGRKSFDSPTGRLSSPGPDWQIPDDGLMKRGGRKQKKGKLGLPDWKPCKKCGRDTLTPEQICLMCQQLAQNEVVLTAKDQEELDALILEAETEETEGWKKDI